MKFVEIIIAALFLSVAIIACAARAGDLPPGTVIITRNKAEELNTAPGHHNHLSIYVGKGLLVEAQQGRGVIKTRLSDFLRREYEPALAMCPCDRAAGERAAKLAESFVGLPYSRLGSIRRAPARRIKGGEKLASNCVTIIKAAYWDEDRRVRRIHFPDDALKLQGKNLFDACRPLAEVLKPVAAPAIPPAEHSVLATPKTRHGYYGDRIVNLGCDNFLSKDWGKRLFLEDDVHAWGWKVHEWKESVW